MKHFTSKIDISQDLDMKEYMSLAEKVKKHYTAASKKSYTAKSSMLRNAEIIRQYKSSILNNINNKYKNASLSMIIIDPNIKRYIQGISKSSKEIVQSIKPILVELKEASTNLQNLIKYVNKYPKLQEVFNKDFKNKTFNIFPDYFFISLENNNASEKEFLHAYNTMESCLQYNIIDMEYIIKNLTNKDMGLELIKTNI
ncbi:TPA: hypothetical protein R1765_001937 [Campylobacter coli]|nr:hypothetical protein [Campylobacter coli]